jgi:hypothetical protein
MARRHLYVPLFGLSFILTLVVVDLYLQSNRQTYKMVLYGLLIISIWWTYFALLKRKV